MPVKQLKPDRTMLIAKLNNEEVEGEADTTTVRKMLHQEEKFSDLVLELNPTVETPGAKLPKVNKGELVEENVDLVTGYFAESPDKMVGAFQAEAVIASTRHQDPNTDEYSPRSVKAHPLLETSLLIDALNELLGKNEYGDLNDEANRKAFIVTLEEYEEKLQALIDEKEL